MMAFICTKHETARFITQYNKVPRFFKILQYFVTHFVYFCQFGNLLLISTGCFVKNFWLFHSRKRNPIFLLGRLSGTRAAADLPVYRTGRQKRLKNGWASITQGKFPRSFSSNSKTLVREHPHMTSDLRVGRQVGLHLILLNRLMQ